MGPSPRIQWSSYLLSVANVLLLGTTLVLRQLARADVAEVRLLYRAPLSAPRAAMDVLDAVVAAGEALWLINGMFSPRTPRSIGGWFAIGTLSSLGATQFFAQEKLYIYAGFATARWLSFIVIGFLTYHSAHEAPRGDEEATGSSKAAPASLPSSWAAVRSFGLVVAPMSLSLGTATIEACVTAGTLVLADAPLNFTAHKVTTVATLCFYSAFSTFAAVGRYPDMLRGTVLLVPLVCRAVEVRSLSPEIPYWGSLGDRDVLEASCYAGAAVVGGAGLIGLGTFVWRMVTDGWWRAEVSVAKAGPGWTSTESTATDPVSRVLDCEV